MTPDAETEVIGRTPRLVLRRLAYSDAALIQPLADNWEVAKQTANLPYPYSEAEARQFVDRAMAAHQAGKELVFAITRRQDETLIGLIGLVADVAPMEVGYWFGQPYWGQGYASETMGAILDYTRAILCGRRLHAVVFEDNLASIRVLTKSGFEYLEGWREDLPHRGGMRSLLRYQWRAP